MARKSKKTEQAAALAQETPAVAAPAPEVRPVEPVQETKEAPAQKQGTPKKRIRIRKKAAKHLSVAVLCNNSAIRRFI